MKTSNLFSLNVRDIAHGVVMAAGGAVFGIVQSSLQANSLNFNLHNIGMAALTASVVYLGKRFVTPAQTILPANNGGN